MRTPLVLLQRCGHQVVKLRVQHGLDRHHAVLHLLVAGFEPMKGLGCIRIVEVTPLPGGSECVVSHALKRKQFGVEHPDKVPR
jgi:hypothetical protein